MAINYYANIGMIGSDIELNYNELLLPVVDNETSAPATGNEVKGQMYFNTTNNTMFFYNGTAWVEMDGSGSGVATIVGGDGIDATAAGTVVTLDSTASLSTSPGSFVDFTGSTLTATTGAIAITGDLSATGTPGPTTFLRGDNKWETPAGAYTKWQYQINGATPIDMIDGEIVDFISNTGIGLAGAAASPNTITISNTGVTSIVAGSNISISGATGAVTVTGTANTTSLGIADDTGDQKFEVTDTVDLQFAAAGGASVAFDNTNKRVTYTAPSNTNTEYNLLTTNGNNPDLVLDPTTGTDAIVNVNGISTTVKVTGSGTNTLEFDLVDDVTIAASLSVTTDLSVGDDIALTGGTSKITGLVTNQITNDTDAANKKYVDDLVAGGLTFKDGFNAGTGAIDGGGNLTTGASRVAVFVGDYYVVTTAGSFYGSVALDIGDSVIAKEDAAQGASDVNDWVIIQGDEGVVSLGLTTGASTGAPLTANATSGAITLTSRSYAGASNAGYVPVGGSGSTFLRGDGTWVTPDNSGGTITSIDITETGNALTITETGTATDPDFNISGAGTSSQVILGDLTLGTLPVNGVTSVNFTTDGTALNVNSNTITGSGTMTGIWQGTASEYVNGLGDRVAFPTIPQGDVTGVSASTSNDELGIIVASSSGPVPVVGLDIKGLDDITVPASTDRIAVYDVTADKNFYVTPANLAPNIRKASTFAGTISSFTSITHGLDSFDVIVQLMGASSFETIHAEVDRTSKDEVTISGSSFPSGDIRVLVSLADMGA